MTEKARRGKLGTVESPPEKPGGEPRPLPSMVLGLLAMAVIALVSGTLFGLFLAKHDPKPAWIAFFAGLVGLWAGTRYLPGLRERTALRRARKDAKRLVKSVRKAVKKQGEWTSNNTREKLDEQMRTVEAALPSHDLAAIEFAAKTLDELADKHLTRKNPSREYVEQIGGAVLVALALRAFAYEAFRIPSTSMVPTLLVGDHLFVNKFIYGLRIPFTVTKLFAQVPERGSIVVFNRPGDESGDDIIKRVIGLPGEKVIVRDRRITICAPNDGPCTPFETKPAGRVLLNADGDSDQVTEAGPFDAFERFEEKVGHHTHIAMEMLDGYGDAGAGEWVVKPGHVFVMGDNRDNSQDSRFGPERRGFGQVPIGHVKGRADIIWLSIGGPHGVRFSRMFTLLD